MSEEVLQRRLDRARAKVKILEGMIEEKTRALYLSNEELADANRYLTLLYDVMPGAVLVISADGVVERVNNVALSLLGHAAEQVVGQPATRLSSELAELSDDQPSKFECEFNCVDGGAVPVLVSWAPIRAGESTEFVVVALDLRERQALEVELRHAQKLESVGQLAAGVAHEINTPMQFIGDNVYFLQEAFEDLVRVHGLLVRVHESSGAGTLDEALRVEASEAIEEADVPFLMERAPRAFERTLEGVERVSSIVSAMKAFSHPQTEKTVADLNELVKTTLTVARNEYKYVADVDMDLGEVPMVSCHAGDLQQVILNLVVNAAHAIQSTLDDSRTKGSIGVRTEKVADQAVLTVSDDGSGIPEAVQPRIFEPFFTTKDVGKGTGQGLAISYAIVTEKHGGSLTFDTEVGRGTTFTVRLPLGTSDVQAAPAVASKTGVGAP